MGALKNELVESFLYFLITFTVFWVPSARFKVISTSPWLLALTFRPERSA